MYSIYHLLLVPNIAGCSASVSAGSIIMSYCFACVCIAFLSSFVMLLGGSLVVFNIPATTLRSSAFFPWLYMV